MTHRLLVVFVYAFGIATATASAQVDGSVGVMLNSLPDWGSTELRARVIAEGDRDISEHVRLRVGGYVDALIADRGSASARTAIVRPNDAYLEVHGRAFELRVGSSRVVWGRLDEFQPTDVVNPIDLSRFLLEGRSEARLPVAVVRGRWFLPRSTIVEALVVPVFRESTFDQLEQRTSPFNLVPLVAGRPLERATPAVAWRNLQGGARMITTFGRVDVGASAYRGFRTFPIFSADGRGALVESFPRFTMVGGDFETVRGAWGIRGEVAGFIDDATQSPVGGAPIEGATAEGGVGVDRRAGDYRIAANVLWTHRDGNDVSLVVSADRSFARETRTVRLFAVYTPDDRTAFVRGIVAASLRDNLSLEGSVGVFAGESSSTLGLLTRRDFLYLRLKAYF